MVPSMQTKMMATGWCNGVETHTHFKERWRWKAARSGIPIRIEF
jgi:hypothetical protein